VRKPTKLKVLVASLLFFVLAEGMFCFVLPMELERLTENTLIVGVLMALPSLTSFLSTESAGAVSDRIGRKPVIMAGILLSLIVYAVIFISKDLLLIAFLLVLYGLRDSLFYTPLEAQVMEITPKGREGEYNGLLWFPFEFGYAASVVLAALILSRSFDSVYLFAFLLTLLSLILLQLFVKKHRPEPLTFKRVLNVTRKSFLAFPSHLAGMKHAPFTEKVMFFFSFSWSVLDTVLWIVVPLLAATDALPLMDAALLMFAYSLPTALSDVLGGALFDRWRSRWFFALAFSAAAIAFAYFGLTQSTSALPLFLISSFLLSAMWVGAMATVSALHKRHRGEHAGLFFAGGYLGDTVGALLVGALGSVSLSLPVYAGAGLAVVCVFASLFLSDSSLRDFAPAQKLTVFAQK